MYLVLEMPDRWGRGGEQGRRQTFDSLTPEITNDDPLREPSDSVRLPHRECWFSRVPDQDGLSPQITTYEESVELTSTG